MVFLLSFYLHKIRHVEAPDFLLITSRHVHLSIMVLLGPWRLAGSGGLFVCRWSRDDHYRFTFGGIE